MPFDTDEPLLVERGDQLFGEKGVAARIRLHEGSNRSRHIRGRHSQPGCHQRYGIARRQSAQRKPRGARHAEQCGEIGHCRMIRLEWPHRHHQQQRQAFRGKRARQPHGQFPRPRVEPVGILQHQNKRLLFHPGAHERHQHINKTLAAKLRVQRMGEFGFRQRQIKDIVEQWQPVTQFWQQICDLRLHPRAPFLQINQRAHAKIGAENIAPGAIGRLLLDAVSRSHQSDHPTPANLARQFADQARFANPRFAVYHYDTARAGSDGIQAFGNTSGLGLSPHQRMLHVRRGAAAFTHANGLVHPRHASFALHPHRPQHLERPLPFGHAVHTIVAPDRAIRRCFHQARRQICRIAQRAVGAALCAAIRASVHGPARQANPHGDDRRHADQKRQQITGGGQRAHCIVVVGQRRAKRQVQIAAFVTYGDVNQRTFIAGGDLLGGADKGVQQLSGISVMVVINALEVQHERYNRA